MHDPASLTVIARGGVEAALEAHKALGAGEDVLLMDDDLDVAHEAALKARAGRLGRLVLGPGAGHARWHGLGVGIAPAVMPGPVGIVSASGSAARELMVLLDRLGVGVGGCFVTGPRDLTDAVGASGAVSAVQRVRDDPTTSVVVVVPWPGDRDGGDRLVSLATTPAHPTVVCAFGTPVVVPPGATVVDTLDAAALAVARVLGRSPEPPAVGRPRWLSGGLVRGLYCGAGLCAEAVWVLSERLGQIATNVPVAAGVPIAVASTGRQHTCVDLGTADMRAGRPHPMLDGAVRGAALADITGDPRVRVVLLDVVLGAGASPDAVADLAAPVTALLRVRPQVSVMAHVVGTERDPQGLGEQERRLTELGIRVVSSNAAAARLAAALVS